MQSATTSGDALVRAAALKLRRQGVGEREIAALAELGSDEPHPAGAAQCGSTRRSSRRTRRSSRAGMPCPVEVPSEPGRTLTSTILAIDPTVSPRAAPFACGRSSRRPDASLRPGTFVTATFRVPLGDRLGHPARGDPRRGTQRLVFVVADGTRFEPRRRHARRRADDFVEVLDGVAAGERVVTSANFLIDSEIALKAAVAAVRRRAGAPALSGDGRRIIGFSARNRGLVLLATLVAVGAAVWSIRHVPLDAIPDLSDTQVIVFSRWDRSPDLVEDQVTYPIVTALLGTPNVKAVRAFSDFGYSYVYVIFQDGTDLYWARSRVLEYLSKIQARLPEGVQTEIGPDATSIGWVFQYALVDRSGTERPGRRSGACRTGRSATTSRPCRRRRGRGGRRLREAVPGDGGSGAAPRLQRAAARRSSTRSGRATPRRAAACSRSPARSSWCAAAATPVDRGHREHRRPCRPEDRRTAPREARRERRARADIRRGVADLDGLGDTVGGIVVMRQGENALTVIDRVKAAPRRDPADAAAGRRDRHDVRPLGSHPPRDRHAVSTRSSKSCDREPRDPRLPLARAVGRHPDRARSRSRAARVHSRSTSSASRPTSCRSPASRSRSACSSTARSSRWRTRTSGSSSGSPAAGRATCHEVRLRALEEVGPSVFFSLLVIAVSFLPVFTLVDQEGRLFKPLAYSKNLAMFIAAILAITLDPALRMLFTARRSDHPPPAHARAVRDLRSSSAATCPRSAIQ
jgi:hypothetical protein